VVSDLSGISAGAADAAACVVPVSHRVMPQPVHARRSVIPYASHASVATTPLSKDRLPPKAPAEQDSRAKLQTLALGFGLQGAVYVHFGHALQRAGKPVRFAATALADERFYREEGGLASDPVLARVALALTPFAWTTGEGTNDKQRWFALRLKGRGICGGVAIPVQDYAAGPACLSLYSAFAGEAESLIAAHGPELLYAAAAFHEEIKRSMAAESAQACGALTPREIECLRLAALGLSGNETAEALGLTPRTVEFHLKNKAGQKESGRRSVLVGAFVATLGKRLRSLGSHALRGVREPVEVFAPE